MAEANTASRSPESTARAIVIGLIVAMIIGSAYPYCVLKLGDVLSDSSSASSSELF